MVLIKGRSNPPSFYFNFSFEFNKLILYYLKAIKKIIKKIYTNPLDRIILLYYNKYNNREKEVGTILTFIVKHKYCGITKVITGYNIWDALKKSGCACKVWTVVSVQRQGRQAVRRQREKSALWQREQERASTPCQGQHSQYTLTQ